MSEGSKTKIRNILFAILPGLVVFALVWSANFYYELDTVTVKLEEKKEISISSSATALTVTQSGSGNIVEFKNATGTVFSIANNGNVTVAGNILPATTTAYNLGSATYKWANIYAVTTTIGGTITIGGSTFTGSGTTTLSTNAGALILNPAGNVGIGTTPNEILTVEGRLSLKETTAPASTTDYGKLYVLSADSKLYFMDDSGTTYDLTAAGISGSGSAGQVTFWTDASTVSGDSNLFWDNTNKRLGIGTTTPAALLDVYASSTATALTVAQSGTGNIVEFKDAGITVFKIADGGNVTVAGHILPATTTTYDLGSLTYKWRNIYAATATIGETITINTNTISGSGTTTINTTAGSLILNPAGNVGIGTTTPAHKLTVAGKLAMNNFVWDPVSTSTEL